MVASGRLATRSGINLAGPNSMSSTYLFATAILLISYQATPSLVHANCEACPEGAMRCIERFGGRVIPAVEKPTLPGVDRAPDPPCPPKPRAVRFFNTHFTDHDLLSVAAALMQIEDLKRLDLSFTRVKGESLGCLAGLPALTELDLSAAPISGDGLRALACLGRLETVKLNRASLFLHDLTDMQVSLGSKLKVLHLSGTQLLGSSSQPLGARDILNWVVGFTKLEGLGLAGTLAAPGTDGESGGVANLKPLAMLNRTLSCLDVSNNNLKPGSLEALTELAHLRELRVGGNADLTDEDVKRIGTTGHLRKLDLSGTQLTDVELTSLATKNTCLVDLNISGTFTLVDLKASAALAKLTKLTVLNIGSTGVRDTAFRAIWKGGTFPKLKYLDISGTMVTDRGLATDGLHPEVGFRSLNSINIANTRVTPGGINYRNALNARLGPLPPKEHRLAPLVGVRTDQGPAPLPRVKVVSIPNP
jgi:Leucine-rich repeat (LRR) protein